MSSPKYSTVQRYFKIDPWDSPVVLCHLPISHTAQDFSLGFYPFAENSPLFNRGSKSMICLCCPTRLIRFTLSPKAVYFHFDHQFEVAWCAENVFSLFAMICWNILLCNWSLIEVYLPWYAENVFTLIINRSLFVVMCRKCFTLIGDQCTA